MTIHNSSLRHLLFYTQLVILHMVECSIADIGSDTFSNSLLLRTLDLSYNNISFLHINVFMNLFRLHTLVLKHNQLQTIGQLFVINSNSITNYYIVHHIDMSVMKIKHLPPKTFQGCLFLRYVNLSFNPLISLPAQFFGQSSEYQYIDLTDVPIQAIHSSNIYSTSHIAIIKGDIPELCCLSKSITKCLVQQSSISNCRYLISSFVLQIFIWLNGVTVVGLNTAVLFYRMSPRRMFKNWNTYANIYTINMAISDLLMGAYMLVIAITNVSYFGKYASVSWSWRISILCKVLAFISTVSSEMSLVTLTQLTVFQFTSIQRVYGIARHVKLYVIVSLVIAWVLTTVVAMIPILGWPYFGGSFVSSTGTCLLYQLMSGRNTAREYSIVIWLFGNIVILLMLATSQLGIGIKIHRSRSSITGRHVGRRGHTNILFVIFVIVAFTCWAPVLITMFLVYTGVYVSAAVSEYLVIMLLPLKAVINPILYTIRTITFKES